jgi:Sulfotransferase family
LSPEIIFVGGAGRSGTTLLARLIGQVPGYVAVGEAREIWRERRGQNRLCGCGATFEACPFWERVGDEAFGGWARVPREEVEALAEELNWVTALRSLRPGANGDAGISRRLANRLTALYRGIAAAAGGATVVDTSKGPPYGVALSFVKSVDFRSVHIVRDSRGIAYSWCKEVADPGSARGMLRMHKLAAVSSVRWDLHNSVMEMLGRRVPSTRVSYEDFIDEVRPTLSRVLGELEEPPAPTALAFVHDSTATLGTDHTVAGNPNRHTKGEVPLRIDSAWRSELPAPVRAQVTAMTWPMLMRYGYEL